MTDWREEIIGHEEFFLTLHDHLPKEMIYERELLICRITARSSNREERATTNYLISVAFHRAAFASTTVNATMLTMRRTVAEGVRMCAEPSNTGPTATFLPAAVLSRL